MSRAFAPALFAMCALLAPIASAQSVNVASSERVRGGMFDASDPERLVRFMTELGYQAELTTDAVGDPLINGRVSSTDYVIQFYECEEGSFCNSVQFLAEAPQPAAATLEQLNAFNTRWRYVRATFAVGLIRLQMDLNLDGGLAASNVEDTLDIWRQLLETFEREFLLRR